MIQVVITFFGGTSFNLVNLSGPQWGISLGIAALTSFGIAIVIIPFRLLTSLFRGLSFPSLRSLSISMNFSESRRRGIMTTHASAFAAIITTSVAGSIAGIQDTTHQFQKHISLKRIVHGEIWSWIPIPLILQRMKLTFYTIYMSGFRVEALADTGASVNLVSESFIQQDRAAWDIVPQKCHLALGNGMTCRSLGYIRTSIRFDNSQESHPTTLHIVNGLPYDVALSHDFLNSTATVQFSRPGGITRDSLSPTGPSQPAAAVILTHLVAVRQQSVLDKVKKCFGCKRKAPMTVIEDNASSCNPFSHSYG